MTILSLDPLEKAIRQLTNGLAQYAGHAHDDLLRDGVIQRFEYTYELSWKMLKRFIELTAADPEAIDRMSFPELIRTGSELGLLRSGWDKWQDFRKSRGTTSHIYDEIKAQQVFSIIPAFLDESVYLLAQLQQRMVKK